MTTAIESPATLPKSQPKADATTERKFVAVEKQPRVVIKAADMPQEMQRKAIEIALTALDRFELEREMAKFLKKEFDLRFQPSWHCIVGRHFGSYVTHESAGFVYFYIEKTAVLLFRSG